MKNLSKVLLSSFSALALTLSAAVPANAEPAHDLIGVDYAHSIGLSGNGQVIAVLDDPIDVNHPQLKGKITYGHCFATEGDLFRGEAECRGGGRQATGLDAASGVIYSDGSRPNGSHGMMVSSLIVGNDVPQAPRGIAYDARVAFYATGSESDNVESALRVLAREAKDQGVTAVTISLSNPGTDEGRVACHLSREAKRIEPLVDALKEADIPVFAASGNDKNHFGFSTRPACLKNIYAVGAVNDRGRIHTYTNVGEDLDFLAPADVMSADRRGYRESSGTSAATPIMAASYSLLKERYPNIRHEVILDAMKQTATKVDDIYFDDLPLINLERAIKYLDSESPSSIAPVENDQSTESSSSDQKITVGTFNGYVVVYAKGYEGRKLSAKIGKDWVIVRSLQSNFENVKDLTGPGVDIAVRVFIDGELKETISVTTR